MSLEQQVERLAIAMEKIVEIMVTGQGQLQKELGAAVTETPTLRPFPAPAPAPAPAGATVTPIGGNAAAAVMAPTLDATRNALATFAQVSNENAAKVQASLTAMNATKLSDLDDAQRGTLLAVLGIQA